MDVSAAAPPNLAVRDGGGDDSGDDDEHRKDGNKTKDQNTSTSTSSSTSQQTTTTQQPTPAPASPTIVATSPAVVPSTPPIPTLTHAIPTSSTIAATTIWLTTSEWSTITSIQTTTAVSALEATSSSSSLPPLTTGIFRGQSDDDDDCSGCGKHHKPPPPNNNKFAIAFGTLGGIGFLVGVLWLTFFVYRWRKKHGKNTMSQHDYASSIGKPSRFNFAWPFGRSRNGDEGVQRQMNSPPGGPRRSNTSIMDEAMRGAYGSDSSSLHSVPHGYLDEKRQDPNYALPLLDPAPIQQASLRKSIASWFRRSNSNHPLRLNPNSRWSRSTTRTMSTAGFSRPTTATSSDPYSASIYSFYASNAPPMPDLDLQRTYTNAGGAGPVELAAPVPAYVNHTAVEAPAPFVSPLTGTASRWSRSTSGHERMSSVSTWTDATQTTISGGRESVPAIPQGTGLSPPGFHRSGNSKDLGMSTGERETAELTNLREELLELYTQGARPDSAVGGK